MIRAGCITGKTEIGLQGKQRPGGSSSPTEETALVRTFKPPGPQFPHLKNEIMEVEISNSTICHDGPSALQTLAGGFWARSGPPASSAGSSVWSSVAPNFRSGRSLGQLRSHAITL